MQFFYLTTVDEHFLKLSVLVNRNVCIFIRFMYFWGGIVSGRLCQCSWDNRTMLNGDIHKNVIILAQFILRTTWVKNKCFH